jgi:hypothetical protein
MDAANGSRSPDYPALASAFSTVLNALVLILRRQLAQEIEDTGRSQPSVSGLDVAEWLQLPATSKYEVQLPFYHTTRCLVKLVP